MPWQLSDLCCGRSGVAVQYSARCSACAVTYSGQVATKDERCTLVHDEGTKIKMLSALASKKIPTSLGLLFFISESTVKHGRAPRIEVLHRDQFWEKCLCKSNSDFQFQQVISDLLLPVDIPDLYIPSALAITFVDFLILVTPFTSPQARLVDYDLFSYYNRSLTILFTLIARPFIVCLRTDLLVLCQLAVRSFYVTISALVRGVLLRSKFDHI